MVARNPSRPKAEHLPDADLLRAVALYADGGAFPTDTLRSGPWFLPAKVVCAKAAKLRQRGLMRDWVLTPAGAQALSEAGMP